MDELSAAIGRNIRKYRKLKGLTIEQLAEILETETNYLGQCERGERRFSIDKLVDIVKYFDVTVNDIIPVSKESSKQENSLYLQQIQDLLKDCTNNQLAVVLNLLKNTLPFLIE